MRSRACYEPPETVTVTMRPRFLERFHGEALRVDVRAQQ
jgi:hypothetical protein